MAEISPNQSHNVPEKFVQHSGNGGRLISDISPAKGRHARNYNVKLEKTQVLSRTVVPKPAHTKKTKQKKQSVPQLVLYLMAVLVLAIGLGVSWIAWRTNINAKQQVKAIVDTPSSTGEGTADLPSETKPTNNSAYRVAHGLPKFLKVPGLGIDARVKSLGVDSKNFVLAPTNIYDVGWYNESAKPGDSEANGAILLDGHVHGPTLPGVFSNIKSLKEGDEIQVQRGDDQIFKYKVVKVQQFSVKTLDMRIALASITPGTPGLNLMTCGGKYDRIDGYTDRTIVFAVLQK